MKLGLGLSLPGVAAIGGKRTVFANVANAVNNQISTPDAADYTVNDDLDVRVRVAANDWTPSIAAHIISQTSGSPNRAWRLQVTTAGALQLVQSTDGTATANASSSPLGLTDGAVKIVRMRRVHATGAVSFDTSDDNVSFTSAGGGGTLASGDLFNSTADINIGRHPTLALCLEGKYYWAQIRIGGVLVAEWNPSLYGYPNLTSPTGETWTAGSAVTFGTD